MSYRHHRHPFRYLKIFRKRSLEQKQARFTPSSSEAFIVIHFPPLIHPPHCTLLVPSSKLPPASPRVHCYHHRHQSPPSRYRAQKEKQLRPFIKDLSLDVKEKDKKKIFHAELIFIVRMIINVRTLMIVVNSITVTKLVATFGAIYIESWIP